MPCRRQAICSLPCKLLRILVLAASGFTPLLTLTSLCSEKPNDSRNWRVTSNFDETVNFTWNVYGTPQSGSLSIPAGDTVCFSTETFKKTPNTLVLTYDNGRTETKASSGEKCKAKNARESAEELVASLQLEVFPNLARNQFTLRYVADAEGKVKVLVTDVLSRPAYTKDWPVQPGVNELTLPTECMKTGQYVITVTEGGKRIAKRLGTQ